MLDRGQMWQEGRIVNQIATFRTKDVEIQLDVTGMSAGKIWLSATTAIKKAMREAGIEY